MQNNRVIMSKESLIDDFIADFCNRKKNDEIYQAKSTRGGSVKCVVLNACNSRNIAEELVSKLNVPFVVSWSTKVDNRAATDFSKAFYNYLGAKKNDPEDFEGGFQAATKFLRKSKWWLEDPEGQNTNRAGIPHLDGARILE